MWDWLWALWVAHSLPMVLGLAVCLAWIGTEYVARSSTWRQGAPKRPPATLDRGTYPFIAIALGASLFWTLGSFLFGWGGYLPLWTLPIGVVTSVVGLVLRMWSLRTLGRFFTMPITIAADHRIVDQGPYRWLRHPAYTGGFLTVLGIPIVLGDPSGLAFTLVACLAAYVYRIQIEEAALIGRFGDEYRAYAARTSRLLPGLY